MKRLTFLALVVASFVMLFAPRATQAATTAVTIADTRNAGAEFQVYDLTPVLQAHSAASQTTLAHELGAKDDQAIAAFIAAEHLAPLVTVTTDDTGQAHFTVDGANGRVYLVVQLASNADNALAVRYQALPIVFGLPRPDQTITLQPKVVSIQRAVYFYKYAQHTRTPLAGAVFALHRDDGQYLGPDRRWRQSPDPRNDPNVLRIASDSQGLVLLRSVALASGHYDMEEVQAPVGYHLTKASRHVSIQIPQARAHTPITVNGVALRPLLADRVQRGEAARSDLWVYNARPRLPETSGSQPPGAKEPPVGRRLPDTGDVKLSLALFGLAIMGMALFLGKKGKHIWKGENHVK